MRGRLRACVCGEVEYLKCAEKGVCRWTPWSPPSVPATPQAEGAAEIAAEIAPSADRPATAPSAAVPMNAVVPAAL